MASVTYRCDRLYHQVFQPETIPETRRRALRSVQIEVTIAVDLEVVQHDCLTDRFTGSDAVISQETHRFDLNVLKNRDRAYEILGAMLSRLIINPVVSFSFVDFAYDTIKDIIHHGVRVGNRASKREPKVLPLRAEIWGMVEKHVIDERALISIDMEESAFASNHGMVPTKEFVVKKMLKRVRLEGGDQCSESGKSNKRRKVKGEDCVICLEVMKFGSNVSQMPCSHTFHGACIKQWLKQSHYCPICRFEMPVSES